MAFFWGKFLVQGFFWVLIFAPIRSSPSLDTRSTPPGDNDPSTKCLRRVNNLNFKLTFTIDINYKRLLRTISLSFLTMWPLASEARSH